MMVLDECLANPADESIVKKSIELTTSWAKRCKVEFENTKPNYSHKQFLFAIIQGSVFKELRKQSAEELISLDFDGYAIGGLAVGEENEIMYNIVDYITDIMPQEKPRYLMGVGTPEDLLNCIELGVDMFDCVMPTRNARNGTIFSSTGKIRIKNLENKQNFNSPDENTDSYTAKNFSLAYLRHLFMSDEILAAQLATIQNLRFYMKLLEDSRKSIMEGRFLSFKKEFLEKYSQNL
jgi:queuine tRNA-ribosyltransferase